MRVVFHLSKYFDWEPVPSDVKLTAEEIAGPLIIPGREPGTYRMRVEKDGPTTREMTINEATIIGQILYEKLDVRRSGATLTRKQAVAHVTHLCLDDGGKFCHARWEWITGIDVHDDGPSEELMKAKLEPHLTAIHGRRGRVHLTPDDHAAHLAAYSEPADVRGHLLAHFGVKA